MEKCKGQELGFKNENDRPRISSIVRILGLASPQSPPHVRVDLRHQRLRHRRDVATEVIFRHHVDFHASVRRQAVSTRRRRAFVLVIAGFAPRQSARENAERW